MSAHPKHIPAPETAGRSLPASAGSAIGRISMAVEVNGKPCFVVLPQDRMMLLVNLAASLSDNGKLPVKKAPEGFQFTSIFPQNDQALPPA